MLARRSTGLSQQLSIDFEIGLLKVRRGEDGVRASVETRGVADACFECLYTAGNESGCCLAGWLRAAADGYDHGSGEMRCS
jgi:hypothetical protein